MEYGAVYCQLLVVEGIAIVGPGVGHVGDVTVVERPNQLGRDQLTEHVDGREEDVDGELSAAQLGERLLHRVVGRERVLAVVRLAEALDDRLVDVRDPVVELQGRSLLGRHARRDRLVVRVHRPLHRLVLPRQRGDAAPGGGVGRAAAGQHAPERQPGARHQQLPAGDGVLLRLTLARNPALRPSLTWMHAHSPLHGLRVPRTRGSIAAGGPTEIAAELA